MDVFEGVDFVRLRSGRAYVHAAEDGRSVCLDRRRASHTAVWAVTPRFCPASGTLCVLLRGAYGRYLGAPDAAAGGSLCPFSSPCRAAKQRDFDKPEIPAILWRAVATSRQGVFLLHDASGRYLRTNPRWLLPCRAGVSVSSCDGLGRAIQWAVEPVPRAGRPDLPIGRDSECGEHFARICPPLSRLCVRWFPLEREIRWRRADGNGAFGEGNWAELRYTGRPTILLKTQLVKLLPPNLYPRYTLCIRAGRYGQPTPLAVNLPRSREPLYIVLFGGNTAVLHSEIVDGAILCPFCLFMSVLI
ncbi:hypothetical protein ACQ4PT_037810 [Festuca glaucescens]